MASARRDALCVFLSSDATWFATVRTERERSDAISEFERPRSMSSKISRSARVRSARVTSAAGEVAATDESRSGLLTARIASSLDANPNFEAARPSTRDTVPDVTPSSYAIAFVVSPRAATARHRASSSVSRAQHSHRSEAAPSILDGQSTS